MTRDIDWFIIDIKNKPIHVASAGGRLPNYILDNDRLNKNILKSLRKSEKEDFPFEINPNLNQILEFESERMRFLYLRDFIFMASKGFYSYDKTILGNFENPMYHLVAWPTNSIILDIEMYSTIPHLKDEFPTSINPFNLFEICK